EGDTCFKLFRNTFGYQMGFQFRTFDLENVDLNVFLGQLLQLFLNLVDFLSTFTDNDTRTRRMYSHRNPLQRTLDHDLRYASFSDTHRKVFPDLFVPY